jgi:hypothetical protein
MTSLINESEIGENLLRNATSQLFCSSEEAALRAVVSILIKTVINCKRFVSAQEIVAVYHSKICIMAGVTNNTSKAFGSLQDASRLRRRNHPNLADDSLIMLLLRGQSLSATANIIQRNSGPTVHSNTYGPRSGLAADLIRRYPSGTSATMNPRQRRVRRSLCPPPNEETRNQNIAAVFSQVCQVTDSDDESDDRRDSYGTAATRTIPQREDLHPVGPLSVEMRHHNRHLFAVLSEACLLGDSDDESDDF